MKMTSRGLRNCNPGNIRKTSDKWKGLRPLQQDPAFFQFVSLDYGYRAMAKTLLSYKHKRGINTIRGFISRWAPSNENHTEKYIDFVANKMQISPDLVIDIENDTILTELCAAISHYENGEPAMLGYVREGVKMALL